MDISTLQHISKLILERDHNIVPTKRELNTLQQYVENARSELGGNNETSIENVAVSNFISSIRKARLFENTNAAATFLTGLSDETGYANVMNGNETLAPAEGTVDPSYTNTEDVMDLFEKEQKLRESEMKEQQVLNEEVYSGDISPIEEPVVVIEDDAYQKVSASIETQLDTLKINVKKEHDALDAKFKEYQDLINIKTLDLRKAVEKHRQDVEKHNTELMNYRVEVNQHRIAVQQHNKAVSAHLKAVEKLRQDRNLFDKECEHRLHSLSLKEHELDQYGTIHKERKMEMEMIMNRLCQHGELLSKGINRSGRRAKTRESTWINVDTGLRDHAKYPSLESACVIPMDIAILGLLELELCVARAYANINVKTAMLFKADTQEYKLDPGIYRPEVILSKLGDAFQHCKVQGRTLQFQKPVQLFVNENPSLYFLPDISQTAWKICLKGDTPSSVVRVNIHYPKRKSDCLAVVTPSQCYGDPVRFSTARDTCELRMSITKAPINVDYKFMFRIQSKVPQVPKMGKKKGGNMSQKDIGVAA